MTEFEVIILIILYLFAFAYMLQAMGFDDEDNWVLRLLIVIAAAMGVFAFPAIFATDVWKKLNKEQQ